MNKANFNEIVNDGLNRGKEFLMVKIMESDAVNPIITIIPKDLVKKKVNEYMKATDNNLVFKDTGNKIEDVLATSSLNELKWFVY